MIGDENKFDPDPGRVAARTLRSSADPALSGNYFAGVDRAGARAEREAASARKANQKYLTSGFVDKEVTKAPTLRERLGDLDRVGGGKFGQKLRKFAKGLRGFEGIYDAKVERDYQQDLKDERFRKAEFVAKRQQKIDDKLFDADFDKQQEAQRKKAISPKSRQILEIAGVPLLTDEE